jgi:MFS family permease
MNRPLRWYLASTACFLVPGGVQMVLFPWLVAVLLAETADKVGIAQMAAQIPALLLILFGGVVGDRFDQRRILLIVHVCMAIPPFVLAFVIDAGGLSFGVLITYALVGGVFAAFSQPARDALLSRVAGDRVQHTVAVMIALQFTVQICGFGLAALADVTGPVPLMMVQGTVMGLGAIAVMRIRLPALPPGPRGASPLHEIAEGVRIVWDSPSMLPAIMCTFAMGIFYAGTFMVLLPLMVRDVYGGGAAGISLVFAINMGATVLVTLWLIRRGGIRRQGRAMMIGLMSGVVILIPLHFPLPIWAFYGVIFAWGIGGGVLMSMSRTIVQEAAPASHRARVMSVFSLGMMGGVPVGSFVMGHAINTFGHLDAALIPVLGMTLVLTLIATRTAMWQVESPATAN